MVPQLFIQLLTDHEGQDHDCETRYGMCYWANLDVAQQQCSTWGSCGAIYETDVYPPATQGNPVFWALKKFFESQDSKDNDRLMLGTVWTQGKLIF